MLGNYENNVMFLSDCCFWRVKSGWEDEASLCGKILAYMHVRHKIVYILRGLESEVHLSL